MQFLFLYQLIIHLSLFLSINMFLYVSSTALVIEIVN